jgi:hypothetical protein
MPIAIEHNGEFLVIKMTGLIALPDLLAQADELAAIEARLSVTPHRITLLPSGGIGDMTFGDLHVFATKRRAVRMKNPVKSAIVAADAVQFGFARMYQTLNENPDITVEIFQSEEPALAWLRE